MVEKAAKRGYVASDLHMMASYTLAHKYWPEIEAAASKANFFVINGDWNELYFTKVPFEERITQAIAGIKAFVSKHPHCEFHYVLGNHENIDVYHDALRQLASEHKNLHIHAETFRMGNALFTHGDLPLRYGRLDKRQFYDKAEAIAIPHRLPRKPFLAATHHLQDLSRTLRFQAKYRHGKDVTLVSQAVENATGDLAEGVMHVFSAHTHRWNFAKTAPGSEVRFYNTGAGVRGTRAKFNMMEISMDDQDHVLEVRQAGQHTGAPLVHTAEHGRT